jgi:SAM-dependent methyltransferase
LGGERAALWVPLFEIGMAATPALRSSARRRFFLFRNPARFMSTDRLGKYGGRWAAAIRENGGNLVSYGQYKRPFEVTQAYVAAGSTVLDWGCGNGHFSCFLIDRGCHAVGYSFEEMRPFLAGLPDFRFVAGTEGDPSRLPFRDGEFDAVFSVGVLEHVHQTGGDQALSVREVYRILKPGGHFLCFHLPNRYTWIEFIARVLRSMGRPIHVHDRLYDRARIAALLEPAGFTVVEAGRYGFLPRGISARTPVWFRDSAWMARRINSLDRVLGGVFSVLCQNWYFVALK